MARKSEVTITLHEDTIQQSQMVPVMLAASSKDPITDVVIWESAHKAGKPDDPWVKVKAITGNNDKDAVMIQPIQIPQSWFPVVIDVYEADVPGDPADLHRSEAIAHDATDKDRTFKSTKRNPIADKDKHPPKP